MLLLYTVNPYFLLYIFFNFRMHFQKNISVIIYLYEIFSILVKKQTNKKQTNKWKLFTNNKKFKK